jgi:hypothetical protein
MIWKGIPSYTLENGLMNVQNVEENLQGAKRWQGIMKDQEVALASDLALI